MTVYILKELTRYIVKIVNDDVKNQNLSSV